MQSPGSRLDGDLARGDTDCYLERTVPGISDNSWLVLDLKKQLAAFRVTTRTKRRWPSSG